jgi:hypothetical protein
MVAKGWYVVYLDVRKNPDLRDALKITETPTYIGYFAGEEVGRSSLPQTTPTTLWATIPQWFPDYKSDAEASAPKPPTRSNAGSVPEPPAE